MFLRMHRSKNVSLVVFGNVAAVCKTCKKTIVMNRRDEKLKIRLHSKVCLNVVFDPFPGDLHGINMYAATKVHQAWNDKGGQHYFSS